MNIGSRIRIARHFLELSQSQLADKAGMTTQWISNYETNRRKPTVENLAKLSIALCVSTDWLLSLKDGEVKV